MTHKNYTKNIQKTNKDVDAASDPANDLNNSKGLQNMPEGENLKEILEIGDWTVGGGDTEDMERSVVHTMMQQSKELPQVNVSKNDSMSNCCFK